MSNKLTHHLSMNNTKEACGKGCETKEERDDFSMKREIITLGLGILIYVVALVFKLPFLWSLSLFLLSYIIISGDII